MRSSLSMLCSRFCCQRRRMLHRYFSTETTTSATHAFDRPMKRLQRDNAARAHQVWYGSQTQSDDTIRYDYLFDELAVRLVDRLDDIRRDEGFPLALDLGAGSGYVYRAICADDALQGTGGGIGGVCKLVQLDSSVGQLHRHDDDDDTSSRCDTYRLVADEEAPLPFPDGTFDLVISSASLHWVNQLPTVLSEIKRVLKPDGCFLWAMLGGINTLSELRASLVLAELEREGGVSPHISPLVQLVDMGALLQRAGFTLPTIDTDSLTVSFPHAGILMEHLQRMGESNACWKRRERTSLDTFLAAACLYDHLFPSDDDEAIEASVQVIYAIGWTPHESQQKPLRRGTATHKVGEIIDEPGK